MRLLLTLATAALVAWAASDLDLELANGSWWGRAHAIVERLATLPERALDAAASEAAGDPKTTVREPGAPMGERPASQALVGPEDRLDRAPAALAPASPPSAPPEPPPPALRQPAAGPAAAASSPDRAFAPVPSDPSVAAARGDASADPTLTHRFVEPARPFVDDTRDPLASSGPGSEAGEAGSDAASAISRATEAVAGPNAEETGDMDAPAAQPSRLDPEVSEEIRRRLDRVMDLASGARS